MTGSTNRAGRNALALVALAAAGLGLVGSGATRASDHLDTRTVIDDPRADIGDLYAWMAPDGRRLNLAMTLVRHTFADTLVYRFHVDSGERYGTTTASRVIDCRFDVTRAVDCTAQGIDRARGQAGSETGLQGGRGRIRVFAGLRDDPFFNNVRGARDAYQVAAAALREGAVFDRAGCPNFDVATSQRLLAQWRQTEGGPATDFLAGWTPASLVVAIDLDAVATGGPFLAVWGSTHETHHQLDRMGRPLTGNAMLAPLAPDDVSDALKEEYNDATPGSIGALVNEIETTLGLYDAFDGHCGNAFLVDVRLPPARQYQATAAMLADDRLWIDSRQRRCEQLFAVERAALAGDAGSARDCGGRSPLVDVDVYRSLLVGGRVTGVDDGVSRDAHPPSPRAFPFLRPPPGGQAYRPAD